MKRLVSWRKTVAGKTALGIVLPLLVVFGAFLAYGLTVKRAQAHRDVEESHSHHAVMLQQLLRETTRTTGGHDMHGLVAAVRGSPTKCARRSTLWPSTCSFSNES